MPRKAHILIVDDDPDIRDTVQDYFELNGYDVSQANDGEAMAEVLAKRAADVVLMDLNLPGDDGLALTRKLRDTGNARIIMLTAAGDTVDRILGLEMGADDYVPKPFDLRELLARVKSVLRRYAEPEKRSIEIDQRPEMIRMGRCMLDLAAHRLFSADGTEIPLTSMEFDLLQAFARNPDRVLTRDRLLDIAHNKDADVFDRSIDVRMARIRRKIEIDPEKPQVLKTVRGSGYIFVSRAR
jgi:two-component system phosphate regulon response regulator OmpR